MQLDLNKILYKGIDYKTLDIPRADYSIMQDLIVVNPLYISKKAFTPILNTNCIITDTFIIIKTKEWGANSGMNIYSIYLKSRYRKIGQIKQYRKADIAHKNVIELRGLFCHFYGTKTQEILDLLKIENEFKLRTLHIDYCVDVVDYSVEDIISEVDGKKYKVRPIIDYGDTKTYYIDMGDVLLRVYDKIEKILVDKKDEEYADYIKLNRNVTRIEVAYKSTRSWSTRTYGAIIKRIEGIFCDTIKQKLNIENIWASIKQKMNVVIEKAEIIIRGLEVLTGVKSVKKQIEYNLRRAKKSLENLQFLLGCKNYGELKKQYSYYEYDSISEPLEDLLSIIYS